MENTLPVQKRILLVDDNEDDIWLMESLLKTYNLRCYKAYSLFEVYEFLDRNASSVWVICLDLNMGVDHGFDFLDRRSKRPELKEIPVIVMTSYADHKTIQLALSKGANDYMIKPIGSDLLIQELRRIGIIPLEEPKAAAKKKKKLR